MGHDFPLSFNPRERQQECVRAVMVPKFVPVKCSHARKLYLQLQNENVKLLMDAVKVVEACRRMSKKKKKPAATHVSSPLAAPQDAVWYF